MNTIEMQSTLSASDGELSAEAVQWEMDQLLAEMAGLEAMMEASGLPRLVAKLKRLDPLERVGQ